MSEVNGGAEQLDGSERVAFTATFVFKDPELLEERGLLSLSKLQAIRDALKENSPDSDWNVDARKISIDGGSTHELTIGPGRLCTRYDQSKFIVTATVGLAKWYNEANEGIPEFVSATIRVREEDKPYLGDPEVITPAIDLLFELAVVGKLWAADLSAAQGD